MAATDHTRLRTARSSARARSTDNRRTPTAAGSGASVPTEVMAPGRAPAHTDYQTQSGTETARSNPPNVRSAGPTALKNVFEATQFSRGPDDSDDPFFQISDELAVAHLTCVALAVALEAREAHRDCLRRAVAEPLLYQLTTLHNLAREIPPSLDRDPADRRVEHLTPASGTDAHAGASILGGHSP